MIPEYDTIDDFILDNVLKTRPMTEDELFTKLEASGKRHKILILYGQVKEAGKRLLRAGKIKIVRSQGRETRIQRVGG